MLVLVYVGDSLMRWAAVITACSDALVLSSQRMCRSGSDVRRLRLCLACGLVPSVLHAASASARALRLRLLDAARRFELEPDYNLRFETIPARDPTASP